VVDLGSTAITGIAAGALVRLRKSLACLMTPKVHEPFQLLGFVEERLAGLGCDILGVWSPRQCSHATIPDALAFDRWHPGIHR
jgi:hypothetical protein